MGPVGGRGPSAWGAGWPGLGAARADGSKVSLKTARASAARASSLLRLHVDASPCQLRGMLQVSATTLGCFPKPVCGCGCRCCSGCRTHWHCSEAACRRAEAICGRHVSLLPAEAGDGPRGLHSVLCAGVSCCCAFRSLTWLLGRQGQAVRVWQILQCSSSATQRTIFACCQRLLPRLQELLAGRSCQGSGSLQGYSAPPAQTAPWPSPEPAGREP